jgi:probable rRNA maturation factor
LTKVLNALACHEKELSVLFTDDGRIAELNKKYLGREGPTNVLAFPMSGGPPPRVETGILGDVVISVDTAVRESEEIGETLEETIDRLLIHGILHLLDYDHERSRQESDLMEKEQARLLATIREE